VLEGAERGEFPDALWTALEENGLTRVLVPEADGGVGGSWEDAFVLLHAAGRWAAPVPLAETIVAAWLLTRAGLDVPSGVLTIAPARGGEALGLVRRDAHVSVDGEVTGIPWGRRAEHLVAVASGDDGPHLVVVSTRDAGQWPVLWTCRDESDEACHVAERILARFAGVGALARASDGEP